MSEAVAAIGTLTVRQTELTSSEPGLRQYDLVLAALSWEERASATLAYLERAATEINLLKFQSISEEVEERKKSQFKRFESCAASVRLRELQRSTKAEENFASIESWIRDQYQRLGRPLKVLMDITCIPKNYILFIVGLAFTRDYFARCDCIYAAGLYDLTHDDRSGELLATGPRSIVSVGEWRSQQVPYLSGENYLPSVRDLFVTLGGEIGLSLPFIERVEPKRLKAVFIDEAAPKDGRPMLDSERSALTALLSEPNVERVDISLGDVVATAKAAIEFCRAAEGGAVTAMAIGCKPHALALGIVALSEKNLEIICRTPTSYKAIDVKASGKIYLYEITDRFDPFSYIDD